MRKRAESELNRASYGHLKSSQQKSTAVNKKSAFQGWRAAPIEWRAAPWWLNLHPRARAANAQERRGAPSEIQEWRGAPVMWRAAPGAFLEFLELVF